MKLATWNINGIQKCKRQGALLRWLREQKPDIVAIQKIKVPEDQFPTSRFEREGYFCEAHCGSNDLGVAIISRKKPRLVQKGLPGQEEFGARLLTVDVDGLEFSSIYAPYGKKGDIGPKLKWFECLTAHFMATRSISIQRVLCGDFNVVPDYRTGPAGLSRSSPNYQEDVRDKFKEFLDALSLFDLYTDFRSVNWEDPFAFKGRQGCLKFSRLEYILGTQEIVDRRPKVEIDFDYAIVKNDPFHWVRAPIVTELRE